MPIDFEKTKEELVVELETLGQRNAQLTRTLQEGECFFNETESIAKIGRDERLRDQAFRDGRVEEGHRKRSVGT